MSNAGEQALRQMALDGDLGNCLLLKVSDWGCGGSDSHAPLYSIKLKNENAALPDDRFGIPVRYCMDSAAPNLRAALLEGYCFSRQKPYEQFSDSALTRKAFLGELGNCKLELFSNTGCGGASSNVPLYRIAFTDKKDFLHTGSRAEDKQYCFEMAGEDLRKALNSGMCFNGQ